MGSDPNVHHHGWVSEFGFDSSEQIGITGDEVNAAHTADARRAEMLPKVQAAGDRVAAELSEQTGRSFEYEIVDDPVRPDTLRTSRQRRHARWATLRWFRHR